MWAVLPSKRHLLRLASANSTTQIEYRPDPEGPEKSLKKVGPRVHKANMERRGERVKEDGAESKRYCSPSTLICHRCGLKLE